MDKIICVGKNYLDHAEEMRDPIPEKPVIFLKPPSVLKIAPVWDSQLSLILPDSQDEFHYECELVFKIRASGYRLKELSFDEAFSQVSIGLDMTNRTQQSLAKTKSTPWTTGKVFPDAAVIGPWLNIEDLNCEQLPFRFTLNQTLKQQGNSKDMRMAPLVLLYYISEFFPICAGDLLFTGTPKGVGAVKAGDTGVLHLADRYQYQVLWS